MNLVKLFLNLFVFYLIAHYCNELKAIHLNNLCQ